MPVPAAAPWAGVPEISQGGQIPGVTPRPERAMISGMGKRLRSTVRAPWRAYAGRIRPAGLTWTIGAIDNS